MYLDWIFMAKLVKKKVAKKNKKSQDFEKAFGGLKKHNLKIKSINVFALKIEYLEEAPAPAPIPAG